MEKNTTFPKRIRNSLVILILGIILVIAGCYEIKFIIQPASVKPNSSFNVKIGVELSNGYEYSDYTPSIDYFGIMLPNGWLVKESPEYWINKNIKGVFQYNDDVSSSLSYFAGKPPLGYYWWGAQSKNYIDLLLLDSGYIELTIVTNEKTGQFNTRYVLGDAIDWNKKSAGDPYGIVTDSKLIPIEVDISSHSPKSPQNEKWEVYPNPSDGKIFIQFSNLTEEVTMSIYDLKGSLLKSEILRESLSFLDFSEFSKGTYIITFEDSGVIQSKRMIIQ